MRNIAFSLTVEQVEAQTKTVTRRLGWSTLKPGDVLQAVDKAMGLKRGESPRKLAVIRVVSVRVERLFELDSPSYDDEECAREGFPHMTRRQFIDFICEKTKVEWSSLVRRIEFEYVEAA